MSEVVITLGVRGNYSGERERTAIMAETQLNWVLHFAISTMTNDNGIILRHLPLIVVSEFDSFEFENSQSLSASHCVLFSA
jgi:hypothetical protein